MEGYIGKVCPFCKTGIKEGDEVAVCSACGIPHHRSCWDENKGCTTFGCSEQKYEERGNNFADVCQKCGSVLGEDQKFCTKCGAPKNGNINKCSKCGAKIQIGQKFCSKCGQKVGLEIDINTTSAINQFNENVAKQQKKNKSSPIIIAVVAIIVCIVVVFTYKVIQKDKEEKYMADSKRFCSLVLTAAANLEDIGNEISSEWYDSIWNRWSKYDDIDEAVAGALANKSIEVNTAAIQKSTIDSLYTNIKKPATDNTEIVEVCNAVKELYFEYEDMYDCILTPEGNLSSFKSEFSNADKSVMDAYRKLNDLVD
ncbi:MAG: zinc-ribbon domain-containing protein [Clostridia bacterium]|nr:zinc-ribbon domain-containing protein [Clostridia bacterium]